MMISDVIRNSMLTSALPAGFQFAQHLFTPSPLRAVPIALEPPGIGESDPAIPDRGNRSHECARQHSQREEGKVIDVRPVGAVEKVDGARDGDAKDSPGE